MPNRPSGAKNLRKSQRKRRYNLRRINALKLKVKEFRTNILNKKIAQSQKLIPSLYKVIDKAAKRGIIKKNAAARKKSRLINLLNKYLIKDKKA